MIKLNTKNSGFNDSDLESVKDQTLKAYKTLMERNGKGSEMLGWLNLANEYDKDEFARIKTAAKKIQDSSEVLVCIGIGGSYLVFNRI